MSLVKNYQHSTKDILVRWEDGTKNIVALQHLYFINPKARLAPGAAVKMWWIEDLKWYYGLIEEIDTSSSDSEDSSDEDYSEAAYEISEWASGKTMSRDFNARSPELNENSYFGGVGWRQDSKFRCMVVLPKVSEFVPDASARVQEDSTPKLRPLSIVLTRLRKEVIADILFYGSMEEVIYYTGLGFESGEEYGAFVSDTADDIAELSCASTTDPSKLGDKPADSGSDHGSQPGMGHKSSGSDTGSRPGSVCSSTTDGQRRKNKHGKWEYDYVKPSFWENLYVNNHLENMPDNSGDRYESVKKRQRRVPTYNESMLTDIYYAKNKYDDFWGENDIRNSKKTKSSRTSKRRSEKLNLNIYKDEDSEIDDDASSMYAGNFWTSGENCEEAGGITREKRASSSLTTANDASGRSQGSQPFESIYLADLDALDQGIKLPSSREDSNSAAGGLDTVSKKRGRRKKIAVGDSAVEGPKKRTKRDDSAVSSTQPTSKECSRTAGQTGGHWGAGSPLGDFGTSKNNYQPLPGSASIRSIEPDAEILDMIGGASSCSSSASTTAGDLPEGNFLTGSAERGGRDKYSGPPVFQSTQSVDNNSWPSVLNSLVTADPRMSKERPTFPALVPLTSPKNDSFRPPGDYKSLASDDNSGGFSVKSTTSSYELGNGLIGSRQKTAASDDDLQIITEHLSSNKRDVVDCDTVGGKMASGSSYAAAKDVKIDSTSSNLFSTMLGCRNPYKDALVHSGEITTDSGETVLPISDDNDCSAKSGLSECDKRDFDPKGVAGNKIAKKIARSSDFSGPASKKATMTNNHSEFGGGRKSDSACAVGEVKKLKKSKNSSSKLKELDSKSKKNSALKLVMPDATAATAPTWATGVGVTDRRGRLNESTALNNLEKRFALALMGRMTQHLKRLSLPCGLPSSAVSDRISKFNDKVRDFVVGSDYKGLVQFARDLTPADLGLVDWDQQDTRGVTLPMHAVQQACTNAHDSCQILQFLLLTQNGSALAIDANQETLLMMTVRAMRKAIDNQICPDVKCKFRVLIPKTGKCCCSVNAVSNRGETALTMTCRLIDSASIVHDLLMCGANPSYENLSGHTPMDIAHEMAHHRCARSLTNFYTRCDQLCQISVTQILKSLATPFKLHHSIGASRCIAICHNSSYSGQFLLTKDDIKPKCSVLLAIIPCKAAGKQFSCAVGELTCESSETAVLGSITKICINGVQLKPLLKNGCLHVTLMTGLSTGPNKIFVEVNNEVVRKFAYNFAIMKIYRCTIAGH